MPTTSTCFTPAGLSDTEEEERAYRRGFDQGVAALAQALGLKGEELQRLAWKRRVHDFRDGRLGAVPPFPTPAEMVELQAAVRKVLPMGS